MKYLEVFQVIFASQIIAVLSATIVLERNRDADKAIWRIEGDVEYFDRTSNLRQPRGLKYLPHDFNYDKLGSEKGIWGIFPKDKNGCSLFDDDDDDDLFKESGTKHDKDSKNKKKDTCDRSASVTFQFKPKSEKIEQVKVKYVFGGDNATLRVLGGKEEMKRQQSHGSDTVDGWAELSTEIHGQTMTLEANVGGLGDYILIDTITVFVQDGSGHHDEPTHYDDYDDSHHTTSSTTPRHPTTSSTTPRYPTRSTTTSRHPTESTTTSRTPTRPTTTDPSGSTPEPKPSPVSGQEGLVPFASLIFVVFLIISQV